MARRLTKVPSSPSPWGEDFFLILKEKAKSQVPRVGSSGEKFKGIFDSAKSLRRRVGKFSAMDEEFFYAVEFGDTPTVERFLDENPNFDVSRQDLLGRTPLRLAVANEHLEIVEMLLEKTPLEAMHEALLIAIVMGHEQIAEVILKSPGYSETKKDWKETWSHDNDESPFSSDITPLILASQYNRYEVVQLLLMKGHRIEKPHQYYCKCLTCKEKLEFDRLRFWKNRLEVYRGLSSEAYISLSSRDPIYTAFELGKELRTVATIEKHYKVEYLKLADQLSDYVVKLLDRVRGNAELETILNKSKYRRGKPDSDDEGYETMARLRMAIEFEEKKFVAHPTCQQKLVSTWYGDLGPYLERPKWYFRLPLFAFIMLVYPFLAGVYLIMPYCKAGRLVKTPCVKLIAQTTYFIVFLVLVLVSSLTEKPSSGLTLKTFDELCFNSNPVPSVNTAHTAIRAYEPEMVYLLVICFVAGLVYQECEQLFHDGVRMYFSSFYNVFDTCMMVGYIASFALKIYSFSQVQSALEIFKENTACTQYREGNKTVEDMFYWLSADRMHWDNHDPYILSEILFGFANVLSFSRTSSLLPANEHFGPMQISLARMLKDFFKFMFILVVIYFSFLVGMVNIYWYYVEDNRKKIELPQLHNVTGLEADKHFGDVINTFRTMYWALFGMGEPNVVELGSFNKQFTQDAGYILYGIYNVVMVILLLNMLIAMMTRSFEMIHRESDIEWKFARSQLYMDYITKGNTLPAPLNIIPSPYAIYRFVRRSCGNVCCKRKPLPKDLPANEEPHVVMTDLNSLKYSKDGMENVLITGKDSSRKDSYRPLEGQSNLGLHAVDDSRQEEAVLPVCGDPRCDRQDMRSVSVTTKRYQIVMKSIIKRHIFKTEYEDMSTGVTMEELKQDISSFRFETLNSLHVAPSSNERSSLSKRLQILESAVDSTRTSLETMHDKLNHLLIRQAKQMGELTPSLENLLEQPTSSTSKRNGGKRCWHKLRSRVLEDTNADEAILEDDEDSGMFYLTDENEKDGQSPKRSNLNKKHLRISVPSDTPSKEAYV